ncbi:polyprenyl synthetase family protein [Polycladidibacter stylochi]|uniref:polyprenyl synthetase family protein n=1 Tax=Polycladidibacter stylochi TaxID=1807766 RepID=UPI0008356B8A|nr:farnesyl diphosphate synthase [Pseudovibrio stylochi]
MTPAFKTSLASTASSVEKHMALLLQTKAQQEKHPLPDHLSKAMQYAALSGGKRLRPLLILETAALFNRKDDGLLTAACALECIHCYSLVHDDLPAMDDDDLRRGRPTTHIAFDEATAILAGDALLTLAFDLIARQEVHQDPAIRLQLSQQLAQSSGRCGMVGGQMLDLLSEHRERSETEIRQLQAMKTGELLRYACYAGATLANASPEHIKIMNRFGEIIGLAFQLADDLLDVTATASQIGKATGKDADRGKATLVANMGIEATQKELVSLVNEAEQLLSVFGEKAHILQQLAKYIAMRNK